MSERTFERVAHSAAGAWQWVRSIPNKMKNAALDRRQAAEWKEFQEARALPTAAERQEQLIEFYGQYENLVETLCDAAQYGPEAKLEERYAAQRAWMQVNYVEIRKYVAAYLHYDVADAGQGRGDDGRSADAFEALYFWPTLREFLRADDGHMIQRIMRTRDALNQYGEHLRQLAA